MCSYLPEKQIHTLTVMNDDPDDYIKRIYTLSTYYGLVFEKYLKIQYLTPYSYFQNLNARVTKALYCKRAFMGQVWLFKKRFFSPSTSILRAD